MSPNTYTLPPRLSLTGKTALVTGSSRGIGRGIALELARRCARVAVHYTSAPSEFLAESVAAEIRSLTAACVVRSDLASPECGGEILYGVQEGFREVQEWDGKVDVLVNNAAVGGKGAGLVGPEGVDEDGFAEVMDVNVKAPMLIVREVLRRGMFPERGGRIVNISSIIVKSPVPKYTLYAISKNALDGLTRQWAVELSKEYHVTVNGVTVGPIEKGPPLVELNAVQIKAREALFERTSAESRAGTIDDIAQIVAWLASEGARWINGDIINGNGGAVYH